MNSNRDFLDTLVASLADGLNIDWTSFDRHLTDDHERRLVNELRVVARIAAAYRHDLEQDDDEEKRPLPQNS